MISIKDNILKVQERIEKAALRAGRDPGEILLVGITKTHPASDVDEASRAGLTHFGENKVQEAGGKIPEVMASAHWHLVGHLQTNKVKKASELFEMIQSLDSVRLAKALNEKALQAGRIIPVLAEVNTSGEESKYGISPESTADFCANISSYSGLELQGLMTIGPFTGYPEDSRPCFKKLAQIRDRIIGTGIPSDKFRHLSMGMTADFEIAIEEGATIIRVGSALFGARNYSV